LAFLFTFLGTELGFLQRILGTTGLTVEQWLLCLVVALTVLIADEIVKVFLRRRRRQPAATPAVAAAAQSVAGSKA
jgi:Ca2+-transporting ATPase